ncbi:MAG: bifunctional DNA-formamidopyrimidine glycosylase/DNA-(apurinic or apyrimidinic site) lyase [Gammaproteobacteria bacterium]|jgi:formamidopyrimidine-DNA glycosylase|nr:bifunctional DNA-formamidopyrimidine glycosylase/DNA-(apurinic or apyrimidinic site) lyase [Gammaproteobacteria bacterium]
MPELPEVETSRRGIEPWILHTTITKVVVRDRRLRWPVAEGVERRLKGREVESVDRRAKYLLIRTSGGTIILHLGMTGSVFLVDQGAAAGIHDHLDFELDSGKILRFRDPRRFGSFHLSRKPLAHPLLAKLGPEPLDDEFDGEYLWRRSRGRKVSIKQFIMNAQVVVGVGNIYASESLFLAGINPRRAAGRTARHRYDALADAIKDILSRAIKAGGTTLRDFYGGDGEPGYFKQQLEVYDREGEHCRYCNTVIKAFVQGQRSTYYCKSCQT